MSENKDSLAKSVIIFSFLGLILRPIDAGSLLHFGTTKVL